MASVADAIVAAVERATEIIKDWAMPKNHGTANNGKYLKVNADGSTGYADAPSGNSSSGTTGHNHNNKAVLDDITAETLDQIAANQKSISQLKQDITQKVDANHTHTDYVSKTGHTANKYLGTDADGNVVEKEAPAGSNTVVENPYSLPIASDTILGGIKAGAKTDTDTVPVHIDADGRLWVESGGTLDIAQIANALDVQANVDEAGDLTLTIVAKGGAV